MASRRKSGRWLSKLTVATGSQGRTVGREELELVIQASEHPEKHQTSPANLHPFGLMLIPAVFVNELRKRHNLIGNGIRLGTPGQTADGPGNGSRNGYALQRIVRRLFGNHARTVEQNLEIDADRFRTNVLRGRAACALLRLPVVVQ